MTAAAIRMVMGCCWEREPGTYCWADVALLDSDVPWELGKWTHVALVFESAQPQFWVNGRLTKLLHRVSTDGQNMTGPAAGDLHDFVPNQSNGSFTIGGAPRRLPVETTLSTARSTKYGSRSSAGRLIRKCSCSKM